MYEERGSLAKPLYFLRKLNKFMTTQNTLRLAYKWAKLFSLDINEAGASKAYAIHIYVYMYFIHFHRRNNEIIVYVGLYYIRSKKFLFLAIH